MRIDGAEFDTAMRSEQEVFDDLSELCVSPGYSHVIAYFCFRYQVVEYGESLKSEEYAKLFSFDRIIRTEISTLIGLMVRGRRDIEMPDQNVFNGYVKRTESLLRELHEILTEPMIVEMKKALAEPEPTKKNSPFANAAVLREPIFYGSESAYSFQYRDLSVEKYANDEVWIKENKKFSPMEAKQTVSAICDFLNKKLLDTLKSLKSISPEKWTVFPGFQFTVGDIALKTKLPESVTKAVIDSFSYQDDGNPGLPPEKWSSVK